MEVKTLREVMVPLKIKFLKYLLINHEEYRFLAETSLRLMSITGNKLLSEKLKPIFITWMDDNYIRKKLDNGSVLYISRVK